MEERPAQDTGSPGPGGGPGWLNETKGPLIVMAVLVGALLLFGTWLLLRSPDDVRNEDAGFTATAKPRKAPVEAGRKTFAWPMFGFDRARTRNVQVTGVRPPCSGDRLRRCPTTPGPRCPTRWWASAWPST